MEDIFGRTVSAPLSEVLSALDLDSEHFAGKSVFLTGGARGIGEQAALGLARLGHTEAQYADGRVEEVGHHRAVFRGDSGSRDGANGHGLRHADIAGQRVHLLLANNAH